MFLGLPGIAGLGVDLLKDHCCRGLARGE